MSSPRRRIPVPKHPGVYYREGADGRRRYLVRYSDSDGRRRWRNVDGGIREARAALEELNVRVRTGELVRPSRQTFREVAEAFLEQASIRESTRTTYRIQLEQHAFPAIGRLRISSVTEDDVAAIVAAMRRDGYSPWTVRGVLTPTSRVFAFAVRRGLTARNPVRGLERSERPSGGRREMRVLGSDEIARLLAAADEPYRALLATAIYTGLRQGELLGLNLGRRRRRRRPRAPAARPPRPPRGAEDARRRSGPSCSRASWRGS